MKQLVLAGVIALASVSALGPPASSAPEDYLDRTFLAISDGQGETSDAGADLVNGGIVVDPNVGDGLLEVRFAGSGPEGDILLITLGQLDGENCVSAVEVLVSTTGFAGPLVRAAGETTTPTIPAGNSSSIVSWPIPATPLLEGFEAECGSVEVRTSGDVLLDEADLAVSSDPVEAVGLGALRLGGIDIDSDPVIQAEPGEPIDVRLKLNLTGDTRAYDVSVTFTPSAGVTVTPDVVEADVLGELTAVDTSVHRLKQNLELTVADPGMHTLTVDLAIGNGSPVSWELDVWGRGGTLPSAVDSLAGSGYVGERSRNPGTQLMGWRLWQGTWFVDGHWAWRARRHTLESWHPRYGVPAICGPDVPGCVEYDYDAATGELILDGWYGVLEAADGWWGWEPLTIAEPDGRQSAIYQHRLAKVDQGAISFTGKNVFRKDETRAFGRTIFTIRLNKDGTFRRTFRQELFEETRTSTTTGTYTLDRRGRLRLHRSGGGKLETFLLAVADADGTAHPNSLGMWIDGVWFEPS